MKRVLDVGTRVRVTLHESRTPIEGVIVGVDVESPEWEAITMFGGGSTKAIVKPARLLYQVQMDCGTVTSIPEQDIIFATIPELEAMKSL